MEIEVGKIINACKVAISVYMGNIPSAMDSLLQGISTHISNVKQESNKNKIFKTTKQTQKNKMFKIAL